MFHKYEARDDDGDRVKRSGVHVFPFWFVVFVLVIVVILAGARGSEIDRITALNASFAKNEAAWSDALTNEKKNTAALLVKYEGLQCSTRNLVITTVKGITLCMNPETKALHKIDANAD